MPTQSGLAAVSQMPTSQAYMHTSALSLLPVSMLAAAWGGRELLADTLAVAFAALAFLALTRFAVSRWTQLAAAGADARQAQRLLLQRIVLAIPTSWLLMQKFGAEAFVLGWSVVLLGGFVMGITSYSHGLALQRIVIASQESR